MGSQQVAAKVKRPQTVKVIGIQHTEKRPMCIGRSLATSRNDLLVKSSSNSIVVASSRYKQHLHQSNKPTLYSNLAPEETARSAKSSQKSEDAATNAETTIF